nr:retrovirus-related Pol polyprotein from transposon TNT 1-94 [Tanacetum cinerariifolium]
SVGYYHDDSTTSSIKSRDGKVDKVPSTSTLVDPTSLSWARPVLTNTRLSVEVFDGTSHFNMWQRTTMNDHITSFNQLVTDLMNMDEVFKDQYLVLILLRSLPEDYELLETTLLNGKDDVCLSKVCAALYSKELRKKDKQISSSRDAEVLLVRGKAVAEANVTKFDDDESDLSLVTSSSKNASKTWILDFACSHHITPHREWFSNFEEHKEVVYTTNETPLTTHGIGYVRLRNDEGIIVTWKGVRYSLKLKKNLISVGTLESRGFKVRAKDGVMKIISGVLVVIKGIHKISNTYHNKGRTIVEIIATIIDGDRNSEAMKLWHMRLGHPGEKSLNLLIKQGLLKGLSLCKLDLCNHYINEKKTRVKFRTTIHKTQEFWAEAVTYACHLINRLPSTAINGKTPFKKWYGKPASDYDSLHVFSSAAYYHVKESKQDPRAKKALFIRITFGIKGYRLCGSRLKEREVEDCHERRMQSLQKNQTWELTNLPEGKKAVGFK